MDFINIDETVERLTKDVKDNKELLYAIANFVYHEEVKSVEFIECIASYDKDDKKSVMLILEVNNKQIGVQFNFNNIDS